MPVATLTDSDGSKNEVLLLKYRILSHHPLIHILRVLETNHPLLTPSGSPPLPHSQTPSNFCTHTHTTMITTSICWSRVPKNLWDTRPGLLQRAPFNFNTHRRPISFGPLGEGLSGWNPTPCGHLPNPGSFFSRVSASLDMVMHMWTTRQ